MTTPPTTRPPSLLKRVFSSLVSPKPPAARPFAEMGVSGTAVYGGYVASKERSSQWVGSQRYVTIADMVTNASIVAAGVHYFLNLIAYPGWTIKPADDSPEADAAAELVDDVIHSLDQPWSRVVRRIGTYRFYGFGVQEWTAKRLDDGRVGLQSIEPRPQSTIEQWSVDLGGAVTGVWQRSPSTGELLGIPRSKILYLSDDTLSDSPEGIGIFRHLAEPWERLKSYYALETRAFERDLRGIPVGRVPYAFLQSQVEAGTLTKERAEEMVGVVEQFAKLQVKQSDTAITLDSDPYYSQAADGSKVAGLQKWGLELLQGGSAGMAEVAAAITRTQTEMARIIACEGLMLGEQSGNRALGADKSRNLYLIGNAVLSDIKAGVKRDIVSVVCDLNGIPEELRPEPDVEDLAFKDVETIAMTLVRMSQAGAVLAPDDPVVEDVRSLLGVSPPPPPSPEMMGVTTGPKPKPKPGPGGGGAGQDEPLVVGDLGGDGGGGVQKGGGNPNHDERGRFSSGPSNGGGGGAGSADDKGDSVASFIRSRNFDTSRLHVKLVVSDDQDRLFVSATRKESELNWLTATEGDKEVVSATFDLNPKNKSVYFNRIDAEGKKGYGREILGAVKDLLGDAGYDSMSAYVQYADQDSQSMMRRMGGIAGRETDYGRYYHFDLTRSSVKGGVSKVAELDQDAFVVGEDAIKMNPNHDELGRFSSGPGGTPLAEEELGGLWSDYAGGASIKAISRGEVLSAGSISATGEKLTQEDLDRYGRAAHQLQELAQSSSGHREVWRGLALPEGTSVRDAFPHNEVITFDSLVAASSQRTVAEKYADPQFIGEESGARVLLRIGSANKINGYNVQFGELAGAETVLPRGARYRVSRIYQDGPYTVVSLYDRGVLNNYKKQDRIGYSTERAVNKDFDFSQPRSLYVSRRLLNEGAVRAWAASQGFESALSAGDMHVTVAYSKEPVDWSMIEPDQDALVVQDGARSVHQFDGGAVVLLLESPDLQRRWQELRDAGASWDYPDYRPHVTITYSGAPADLSAVEPYRGPLIFGPEEMEEVDPEGFDPDSIEEEALPKALHKMNPNHDEMGRFSNRSGGSRPPGEDGPVLYHGTSSQLRGAIMQEGLRPGRASSADAWAKKHGWAVHAMTIGDRAASVYATPDRAAAERYARYAQEVHGGDPVILEVRIPRARRDELLSVDEEDRSSVRFKGIVRPEWISVAKSDDPVIFVVAAASSLKKGRSVPRRHSRRM